MKERGFEKVSKYIDVDFNLPKRSTKTSAGYDFESPVDIDIAPGETVFVPTGIKAYMQDDEVLHLYNRSSNGVKGLILINSVGIIDSDYYNNPDNEGEMAFVFKNTSDKTFSIKQGDRIGQGVFQKFLTVDNEEEIVSERKGGFGSTDKKGITLIALGITMVVLIIILSITVSLTVYNIDQSRKNTFLSEVQIVQNAALEIINTSKIDGMDVPERYKTLPLTPAEINEYSQYLTSTTNDYYFLTYNQLKVMGITNMKEEQQFIINWSTGEVLNLNVSKYKGTTIKANPVI